MQKPSLGRIVLLSTDDGEIPAIITRVHSDTFINLFVFPDTDMQFRNFSPRVTCALLSDSDEPQLGRWRWPPRV